MENYFNNRNFNHVAIINGAQKALHSTVADPSILAGVLSNEFNYVSNSNAGHARTEGRLGSGVADIHSERTQRGAKKTEKVAFFPSLANIVTCIRVARDNEIAAGAGNNKGAGDPNDVSKETGSLGGFYLHKNVSIQIQKITIKNNIFATIANNSAEQDLFHQDHLCCKYKRVYGSSKDPKTNFTTAGSLSGLI